MRRTLAALLVVITLSGCDSQPQSKEILQTAKGTPVPMEGIPVDLRILELETKIQKLSSDPLKVILQTAKGTPVPMEGIPVDPRILEPETKIRKLPSDPLFTYHLPPGEQFAKYDGGLLTTIDAQDVGRVYALNNKQMRLLYEFRPTTTTPKETSIPRTHNKERS